MLCWENKNNAALVPKEPKNENKKTENKKQ